MSPKKPKERNPLEVLHHIAYRMSQPPGRLDDAGLKDFVNFAKFEICNERNLLYYDKIWDVYTDEQVLTEYFAIRFTNDEEFRRKYEAENGTPREDDVEWMFREIEKNKAEMGVEPSKAAVPGEKTEPDGFDETVDSLVKDTDDGILD